MPLLGKEVLAAYVCSTLVTRSTAVKNLSLGCQLPKLMRILSGTCAGLIHLFFGQNLLCGDADQRTRECDVVFHKDAYADPANSSMRVLCIYILAGTQPRRAAAGVLQLLLTYCAWQ